jgi:ubiquinol-cytochrome c reductase cytochrome c subunit
MKVFLLLLATLALVLVPAAAASNSKASNGRSLYFANCVWCHGDHLQGIEGTSAHSSPGNEPAGGPPLLGVGALAADLYLTTGYMPLRSPRQQPKRRKPHFDDADIAALVGFIGAHGGPPVPQPHPERGNLATGLKIFTEHCAGCHQMAGEGGIVSGASVPALKAATATQIAEAVRVGPYVMPRFDKHDISPRELDSLVRYVLYTDHPNNSGGWSIGLLGPFPEGMVAWLIAGIALLALARVIGEGIKR